MPQARLPVLVKSCMPISLEDAKARSYARHRVCGAAQGLLDRLDEVSRNSRRRLRRILRRLRQKEGSVASGAGQRLTDGYGCPMVIGTSYLRSMICFLRSGDAQGGNSLLT